MNTIEELHYQVNLAQLGAVAALNIHIKASLFLEEVSSFKDHWKAYNPKKQNHRRYGLSLTSLDGSMSGIPDLDSVIEYNIKHDTNYSEKDFCVKTEAYKNLSSLHPVLDLFSDLGRSHLIQFEAGGFFPPHRDPQLASGSCFRIITFLNNCSESEFCLLVDGEQKVLEPWRPHYLNTFLKHSVFAFSQNAQILVMNVPFTLSNYRSLYENLSIR